MRKAPRTGEFYAKQVSMAVALLEVLNQLLENVAAKTQSLTQFMFYLAESKREFTPLDTAMFKNCEKIRSVVNDYVQDRKSGKRKASVANNSDILSLFLSNQEVFTDDFIVDELIDFFGAASVTTMNATQTIVAHFIKEPKSLQRVRSEFKKIVDECDKEDPSLNLKNLSRQELLDKVVTLDKIVEFDFLGCVISEAMRYMPPATESSNFEILEDFTSHGIRFQKGDEVVFVFDTLHRNSKQW